MKSIVNSKLELSCRVVNLRKEKYDVYIGRGSEFGNPFRIGIDGCRSQVIRKYKVYFNRKVTSDPAFREFWRAGRAREMSDEDVVDSIDNYAERKQMMGDEVSANEILEMYMEEMEAPGADRLQALTKAMNRYEQYNTKILTEDIILFNILWLLK